MKFRIGTKITLGFFAMLSLAVIIGVISVVSTKSIDKDLSNVQITNERLSLEKNIEIYFYQGVSDIRGFIAYGNTTFRDKCVYELNQVLKMEKSLLEIASSEQKQEVQKLLDITDFYNKGIVNDLIPAIEKRYKQKDAAAIQAAQKEVEKIAGDLVPITGQLTDILRVLVTRNEKIFNDDMESADVNCRKVINNSTVFSIIALLAGAVMAFFITRSIRNPILAMVGGAEKFARGDFTGEIKVRSSDEIGDLALSLNKMAAQLRALISEVITNAQVLAAHSEELAASSQEVSATIEEVASTTNEVAATAEKGAENADTAASESRKAVDVAVSGDKAVQQTVEKINSISKSTIEVQKAVKNLGDLSTKIGKITNLITDIAEQTNLLALNAAIEAARAGEQGRGFAVVAEEVRKLAEQSANAAKEISQLINHIQGGVDNAISSMEHGTKEVSEGVMLADNAGKALKGIIGAVNKSIDVVEEIAKGSKQTSEGTNQLLDGNEQVNSAIQQIATATQELANIANKLQISVDQFKV